MLQIWHLANTQSSAGTLFGAAAATPATGGLFGSSNTSNSAGTLFGSNTANSSVAGTLFGGSASTAPATSTAGKLLLGTNSMTCTQIGVCRIWRIRIYASSFYNISLWNICSAIFIWSNRYFYSSTFHWIRWFWSNRYIFSSA